MRLVGTFNNIDNSKTYYVKIGYSGVIKTIQDTDDNTQGNDIICFGKDPVSITSDMEDSFEHVYIRNASIQLVSNYDVRPDFVSNNFADIPIEIRYNNASGDIIFSGFVSPLSFDQSFDKKWNVFTLECYDKLGALEYIKFAPLLNGIYDYNTPRYFMQKIWDRLTHYELGFTLVDYSNLQYDYTNNTKINPSIFVGDDPDNQDDWLTCQEVLEEIGKIYGCYFWQDGDVCKIENVLLYDTSSYIDLDGDDFAGDDTSISISDAYNTIKCEVDLSSIDETFLDPFDDEFLVPVTDRAERVLTELMYKNKDKKIDNLISFRDLCDKASDVLNPIVDWSRGRGTDTNKEIYDNYCQILRNEMFEFPGTNYLNDTTVYQDTDGSGHTINYSVASTVGGEVVPNTKDNWKVLKWLYNHPGKGAFLSFGKTQNIWDPKNKTVVKLDDMKNMLLIQMNGPKPNEYQDYTPVQVYNYFGDIIYNNWGICSCQLSNSYNFVPNDRGTTNYLVISGKIRLNPITPRTGPLGDWDWDEPELTSATNAWLKGYNRLTDAVSYWNSYWRELYAAMFKSVLLFYNVVKNKEDDEGYFYQNYTWDNTPEGFDPESGRLYDLWPYNQAPNPIRTIAMPYLSPKYERWEYKYSSYELDGDGIEVDNVDKLAILACQLKIGNKVLVENLDMAKQWNWQAPYFLYSSLYKWYDLDDPNIPTDEHGNKQTWFTIPINPGIGDKIVGKDFEIMDTVDIRMNIDAKGLAIPIPYDSGLNGQVEFTILGPYNIIWYDARWYHAFFPCQTYNYSVGIPILGFVENIQISDLKMELYSDNGGKTQASGDNDLVYYSDSNYRYTDDESFDCKFCTSLTSDQVHELGISYNLNNSSIVDMNDHPWYGMSNYNGRTYSDPETKIKLEEARVFEQYKLWNRPRSIVETTLKLDSPELGYLKNNYRFNYLKYKNGTKHIYRTLNREVNLKFNTMYCTMKEISEKPNT